MHWGRDGVGTVLDTMRRGPVDDSMARSFERSENTFQARQKERDRRDSISMKGQVRVEAIDQNRDAVG